ncbi:hypothetical protein [Salibacterium aidingense]|uniref:hypothetical protein n=1 Tax=Salibacterium aidingense TaxID=384933 RepID=UPI000412811E|nr:hypothetical protein [Salibacterium aidingense]
MKFEYQPFQLKQTVQNKQNSITFQQPSERYRTMLIIERLKKAFHEFVNKDDFIAFLQWAQGLKRREIYVLPSLFEENMLEKWKHHLGNFIVDQAKKYKRMFRHLLNAYYHTNNTRWIWEAVQTCYVSHQEFHEKFTINTDVEKWNSFLEASDPNAWLVNAIKNENNDYATIFKRHWLTESTKVGHIVLIKMFLSAEESFFIENESLFEDFYTNSTDQTKQLMTQALIQNCRLSNVYQLARNVIYPDRRTHRRHPMLWKDIKEKEKEEFARWILRLEIKNFFEEINTSHERFHYWKKFVVNLEDLIIIDEKKTMLMFFKDVVVMEVLGTGAVYIYSRHIFDEHFWPLLQNVQNYYYLERRKFMNKDLIIQDGIIKQSNGDMHTREGRLIHSGAWQSRFDSYFMLTLNWEVNEDVLAKKEREQFKLENDPVEARNSI